MKAPVMTVIGSLSFASGCLIVAANSDKLATGREFVSQTKENTSTASIFLLQILACIEIYWPLILLASAIGFLIFYLVEKPLAARILIAMPLLAVTYTIWRIPRPTESDLSNFVSLGNVECICKIESQHSKNSYICTSTTMLFPTRRNLSGKVLVTICGDQDKQVVDKTDRANQTVKVFGKLARLSLSASSWQRNRDNKLVSSGIFSRLTTDSTHLAYLSEVKQQPTPCSSITTKWNEFWQSGRKTIIQSHVENLGEERGALLASMVLGDRVVKLPDQLKALFRTVGLSHLLAASGFNLSIVVATSYFCARLLPLPTYCACLIALLSTASFVCLAGPSPSVVRAALLCVLFLTAKLFHRRVHALAALSLTLVVALLANPLCIKDVGLQLSYVATAGIISGLQLVKKRPPDGIVQRLQNWFKDTVSVIFLAHLSILPLQLLYFGTAGILFLPANLLVDPVVAPVTVVGFLSSVIAFGFSHSGLGITGSTIFTAPLDRLTSFALDYMIACTAYLAKIEGTTIQMAPPVPGAIAIYYFCFMYFLYTLPNRQTRMLGLIALLLGLSLLLFRPNIEGEITYLSKNTAMIISDKNAQILNSDKCDWLGKQLSKYAGCNRIYRKQSEEIITTYFDRQQKPFEASTLDLHDFILVSLKSASKNRKSSVRRKPLSWAQMNRVATAMKTKRFEKPIVFWTAGRATKLRQYWDKKNLYIASVNPWRPLLITRDKRASVQTDQKAPTANVAQSCTMPDPTANQIGRQERATDKISALKSNSAEKRPELFYPFTVREKCGDLLVLQ